MNFAPKYGRWGRKHVKRSPAWKKAIVTVAQGQKLDIFEVCKQIPNVKCRLRFDI